MENDTAYQENSSYDIPWVVEDKEPSFLTLHRNDVPPTAIDAIVIDLAINNDDNDVHDEIEDGISSDIGDEIAVHVNNEDSDLD